MISRTMSKIETNVLNLIINRATFEEPIKAEKVRQETGLSKRSLEEVIESLRVNFKHPIVAKKRNLADITYHVMKTSDKLDLRHTNNKSELNRKILQLSWQLT